MNKFMKPSILFDAGAGDGGGGGAGNSTGGGASGNAEGLTEERVFSMINDTVNKAMSGRDKRIAKQVTESLVSDDSPLLADNSPLLGAISKTVSESITKVTSNNTNATKSGNTGDEGNQLDEETASRLANLEKTNEKLSERVQKAETEKAEMTKKQIAAQRDELALKDLKAAGFDTRGEALLALLERKGLLQWDGEEGEVGKPIVIHDDQEIPFAKYLTDVYAKGKEGQSFMDASPRSGSGGTGGENPSGAGLNQSFNVDSMSDKEVMNEFNKQVG